MLLFPLGHAQDRLDAPPINYSSATPDNPVEDLQKALDAEAVTLDHDPNFGYLKAVLDYLGIPEESQVLVFSKTSLQNDRISPRTPRAIYFGDETYVGAVQRGELLEISVADPNLGAVFYTLPQQETQHPKFVRKTHECLQCHEVRQHGRVPGHLVRSVFPDSDGFPILTEGTHFTTQDSPFAERWGGWYVTGTHGDARHMGNVIAERAEQGATLDMEAEANRTALDPRVNTARYLTPHSDIVALMVLEHQAQMHNLLTEANYTTRLALRDQAILDQVMGDEPGALSEANERRIANIGDKVLRYMLFVDEPLLEGQVEGTSGFAEAFASLGPHDSEGNTLRALDLKYRLFDYPLSYLIYSPQFEALPAPMKDYLYQRLWEVLNGETSSPGDYRHITRYKRGVILQILRETKPGLPAYWYEDAPEG